MAEVTNTKDLIDQISIQKLIEFLEYEEGLTIDVDSAIRIRNFLIALKVWNYDASTKKG